MTGSYTAVAIFDISRDLISRIVVFVCLSLLFWIFDVMRKISIYLSLTKKADFTQNQGSLLVC